MCRGLEYYGIPRWSAVPIDANRGTLVFLAENHRECWFLWRRLCSSSVRTLRGAGFIDPALPTAVGLCCLTAACYEVS